MKRRGNFNTIFTKFINSNKDLVKTYEDIFNEKLIDLKYDIQLIYESINTNYYISYKSLLTTTLNEAIYSDIPLLQVLNNYKNELVISNNIDSSTKIYFNEVNRLYDKNNNNYDIEFCEDNRDKLIEMNLKSVIAIARKYQNLGLSLEDLISAGNIGLVVAYDKYDPSRSKLKNNIKNKIKEIQLDELSYDILMDAVSCYLSYGNIKPAFNKQFKPGNTYSKKEVLQWVDKNIRNAKFSSVAAMWIKAYIIQELHNNSIVKSSKSDQIESKYIISIDDPCTDDNKSISNILYIESDDKSDLDITEDYIIKRNIISKLFNNIKSRDRSIIMKRFGIGLPRAMDPVEIAEQSGLSVARVSQIVQDSIDTMIYNSQYIEIDDVEQEILRDFIKDVNI